MTSNHLLLPIPVQRDKRKALNILLHELVIHLLSRKALGQADGTSGFDEHMRVSIYLEIDGVFIGIKWLQVEGKG